MKVVFDNLANFLSISPNQTPIFAVCLPGPSWKFLPFLFLFILYSLPYMNSTLYSVHVLTPTCTESIATLPPFGPIEGYKWFDQISSQWESQKNRFAFISFGKNQFLPPCFWNRPFMSTASVCDRLLLIYGYSCTVHKLSYYEVQTRIL